MILQCRKRVITSGGDSGLKGSVQNAYDRMCELCFPISVDPAMKTASGILSSHDGNLE
jgi:hypothetical protein